MHRRSLLPLVVAAAVFGLFAAIEPSSAAAALPVRGATVLKPPLLRWHRVSGARYYNIQVYRNGRKLLTRWPRRARLRLHWSWRHGDHRHRFRSGVYRWYVWPHRRNRYGRLIVRSWFQAGRPPRSITPPHVGGEAREDVLLTASRGTWSGTRPIQFAYQWQRCDSRGEECVNVLGERAPSRVLTAADIDATVRVVVTGRNWLGRASVASEPTRVVLPAVPRLVAAPRMSGRPQVGQTLTSDVGAWATSRPLTYRLSWKICKGASCRSGGSGVSRSFLLREAALERTVRVVVTASNAGGSAQAVSAPSRRVGRTLVGTNRADRLIGSAGADVLVGRRGDDRLRGGAGPDWLVGGRGFDRLYGGWGNDRIDARDHRRDEIIDCGDGQDLVLADRRDRVAATCETVVRRQQEEGED
jgi:hypothetical protein